MSYTVDRGVKCRHCDHIATSMDAATDHVVNAHGIMTDAVDRGVEDGQCQFCDAELDGLDAAVDHLEDEHHYLTNAVLDSVRRLPAAPEAADD